MTTPQQQLIEMVNQIVNNNTYQGDEEAAIKVSVHHIKQFWARSMKKDIIDYAQNDGSELNSGAKVAIAELAKLYS